MVGRRAHWRQARAEAASFAVLLGNLLITHTQAITRLVGPLHGTAYLVVIAATSMAPSAASPGTRWRAAIPGVGGLLALRLIRNRSRGSQPLTRHTQEG